MKWITMLVVGIVLALAPLWGVIGTLLGMTEAFAHLSESNPQPGALAGSISFALWTTVAGFILCPIGLVLIVVAAFKMPKPSHHGNRKTEACERANH